MKKSFDLSVTSSLLIIMCGAFLVARFNAWQTGNIVRERDLVDELVAVEVCGEVRKPGIYSISMGTPLQEVMKKARPKPLSDLRGADLKGPVVGPVKIEVAALQEIVVKVVGAVEPVELTVAAGSRICDLKAKLSLKEADLAFFKKKRKLKNGEVLEVPYKRA